jgi:glycosyltransferase involved in cell wall biosynthesis
MLFSIIIPSYNRANFLPRAIQSVISQQYENWELIIIDDGSTDNTKEVVAPFLVDIRIKYIYQSNAERSAARNHGIKLSKGDFITFMDSDEYIDNDRLLLLFNGIKNNKFLTAMYFTDIRFEFPDTKYNYIRRGRNFSFPINPDDLIQTIIGNPQFCSTKEVLDKYQFNEELTVGEDMELLFRISKEYPLIYLENNETITEIEHQNRSVSYDNYSNIKQIETFKIMFSSNHPANKVSKPLINDKWSEVYLRACFYHIYNQNRINAIIFCIKAIIANPKNKLKFKVNILIKLFLFVKFDNIKLLFN